MSNVSVTNTFIAGTTAVASQVNTNFSDLVNYINNRNSGISKWDKLNVLGDTAIDGYLSVGGRSIASSFISVKNYGAKGDGVSDDTASIQAALNSGFYQIYFPSGIYNTTGLTVPTRVQLLGDGVAVSSINYTPATGNCITFDSSCEYNQIINLKISSSAYSTGWAIYQTGTRCADFRFDNFALENFYKGFYTNSALNGRIIQGRISGRGKGTAGGMGIQLASGSGLCTISDVYCSAILTGMDIDGPGHEISRCIFENNTTGIIIRNYVTMVCPYFNESDTVIQTIGSRFTLIFPIVYYSATFVDDVFSRMTLDSSGQNMIFIQQKTAVRASRTSNQSISTGGAGTVVVFDVGGIDKMTEYNTGTGVFTAKKPGEYRVSANVYWSGSSVLGPTIMIYKNGAVYSRVDYSGSTNERSTHISDIVNLVRGDTIDIRVIQTSGGSVNIGGSTGYTTISIEEK